MPDSRFNELNRRLTRMERLVPAIGRTINAVDKLAWVVGNEAPHLSDFVTKATDETEEAKRILSEYGTWK